MEGNGQVLHPITLTTSTGRCGTTFLVNTFKKNFSLQSGLIAHDFAEKKLTNIPKYLRCYDATSHAQLMSGSVKETLDHFIRCSDHGPVVDFGHGMMPLIHPLYQRIGTRLRVLNITRHPVQVAASLVAMGFYSSKNMEWFTPFSEAACFRTFAKCWPTMSPFEKNLYRWLEFTTYGLEIANRYPQLETMTVRSMDIFSDPGTLERIADFVGFRKPGGIEPSIYRHTTAERTIETYPVGNEWQNYDKYPEITRLAQQLGYSMEHDYVESLIQKYLLKKKLGARMRHYSGYWRIRNRLGTFLRSAGVLKTPSNIHFE